MTRRPSRPSIASDDESLISGTAEIADPAEVEDCGDCAHETDVNFEDSHNVIENLSPMPQGDDTFIFVKRPSEGRRIHRTTAREGVNLRAGPGTEFPAIRSLPLGSKVHLLKREGRWGQIDEQGDGASDGFVHLSFLEEAPFSIESSITIAPADQTRTFWTIRNPRGARLYDRYGNALVDPQLLHASAVAAVTFENQYPTYRVEVYGPGGGLRTGGRTKNHTAQPGTGRGSAIDFVIIDLSTKKMLTNHPGGAHQHQGTVGENAPLYQSFYNEVVRAGAQLYSQFSKMARFGGYFASGDNAMDTMHIDMRGLEMGTSGGNLKNGFTRQQMNRWNIPENRPYNY